MLGGLGNYCETPEKLHCLGSTGELLAAFAEQGGLRAVGVGTRGDYSWHSHAPHRELNSLTKPSTL